jgi:hypothetical protein
LSSAILYLAIVAIWAIVLVPRWLRPPQASRTLESNLAEPVDASPLEDLAEAEEDAGGEKGLPDPGAQAAAARARPPAAERRARILQARRRMLVTLTVLTAGAVGIAVTRLAASWVVIPPAVMLAGFVLLLRAAARTDAGRAPVAARRHGRGAGAGAAAARWHTKTQAKDAVALAMDWLAQLRDEDSAGPPPGDGQPATDSAPPGGGPGHQQAGPAASAPTGVPSAQAGVPSAQIIDISSRAGDQLYDQYADAEVRAVGD